MKPVQYVLFLIYAFSSSIDAATTIEEFSNKYADAYLNKDVTAISKLYYDAWSQCKYPHLNEKLKQNYIEKSFDSEIYENFRIEVEEIDPLIFDNKEGSSFTFGISDVTYYPIKPTHRLSFWLISDKKASVEWKRLRQINGSWFIVHTCAGDGAEEYLETYKALEESLKNI